MSIFHGPTTNTNQTGTSTASNLNTSLQQGTNASTNQQTGQQTSQFNNTTTPNLPGWYSSFLQSLPGQYQSLTSALTKNINTPLYGAPQQAAFQNDLAHSQGAAQQQLNSQLASRGALNSGRADIMDTNLALGGQKQLGDYLAAVPGMNAQYQNQNIGQLSSLLGQQAGFSSPIGAFGTTQSGTQDSLNQLINNLFATNSQSGVQTGTQSGQTSNNSSTSTTPNILGGALAGGLGSSLDVLGKLAGKL